MNLFITILLAISLCAGSIPFASVDKTTVDANLTALEASAETQKKTIGILGGMLALWRRPDTPVSKS